MNEAVSLTVGGTPVTVRADGSFDVTVSLVEGTNAIAIRATDPAGNVGTSSITIVRDSTPPALTLDALPTETSSPTVVVKGTVESGISFVTVNGQPVSASGGTYEQEVALSFGSNVIFVEATDGAGNRRTLSAAVSYVPTGVTTSAVGLVLLPVLAVIALIVGLAIGQWLQARRPPTPPEGEEEGGGPAEAGEEELPSREGEL